MVHTIYANQVDEVTKRLARLAKKAARYNIPFSYSFGEEYPKTILIHEYDEVNHCMDSGPMGMKNTMTVAAIDVDVKCDGLIMDNGWTVMAHIEHGESGNIVTGIGATETKNEWFTVPGRCDHCHTERVRKFTYIVEKDGVQKQVGKSCLKEYTGIAPETATMWAEVHDIFPDMENYRGGYAGIPQMWETKLVLALAYDSIKKHGYRRSDMSECTRLDVIERLRKNVPESEEAKAEAEKIVAWLLDIGDRFDNGDPEVYKIASDIERNCVPFARSEYVSRSGLGRLCYIPVAYAKYVGKQEKRKEKERQEKKSRFVGNIGDRIEFIAKQINEVTSWETQFGTTYLYKMTDESGNIFSWFASGRYRTGENIPVKGTVKAHNEYNGAQETVLTRCRLDIK